MIETYFETMFGLRGAFEKITVLQISLQESLRILKNSEEKVKSILRKKSKLALQMFP